MSRWLLLACLAGCSGFQVAGDGDGAPGDGAALDGSASEGGPPPGDFGAPNAPCRALPLDCLDPTPANVIEVPTEATAAQAFAMAKAGDTIQLRGVALGGGFNLPALTTLRGCLGARLTAGTAFAGSGGTVEGLIISGTLVANQTGSYVVRYNRFVDGGAANTAGVSARSIDALVSATVTALVDSNWFDKRAQGAEARTQYDTGTHSVDLTLRNNVFDGVAQPLVVDQAGLVGKITVTVEQNTFHQFDKAIALYGLTMPTVTSGNLYAGGSVAVAGSAPFEVRFSLTSQVTTPSSMPPFAGAFVSGDPAFVDAANADFRLTPASPAIDVIPANVPTPGLDYFGCPRPVAFLGTVAMADIGALESQR